MVAVIDFFPTTPYISQYPQWSRCVPAWISENMGIAVSIGNLCKQSEAAGAIDLLRVKHIISCLWNAYVEFNNNDNNTSSSSSVEKRTR